MSLTPQQRLIKWARWFEIPQFSHIDKDNPYGWLESYHSRASEDEQLVIDFLLGVWGDQLQYLQDFNIREAWAVWNQAQKSGFKKTLADIDKQSFP